MFQGKSIQRRLLIVGTIAILGFTAICFQVGRWQQERAKLVLENKAAEKHALLARLVERNGQLLKTLVNDYSRWDELVSFIDDSTEGWAEANLVPALATFSVDIICVLDSSYRSISISSIQGSQPPLHFEAVLARVLKGFEKTSFLHGFVWTPSGLLEIRGAPVQPTADLARVSRPHGYLIGAMCINEKYITGMSTMLEGKITLNRVNQGELTERFNNLDREIDISTSVELAGPEGKPVAEIAYRATSEVMSALATAERQQTIQLLTFSIGILAVVFIFLHAWILKPLRRLTNAIQASSNESVEQLANEQTELGEIARAVSASITQHQLLISERQALMESELRYESLFNSVLEGIGLVDQNDVIQYCNPAFARIFDKQHSSELLGRSILDFIPSEYAERIASQNELRKKGISSSYELEVCTENGGRKFLHCAITPFVDWKEERQGALATMLDITERKSAERALRDSEAMIRGITESAPDAIIMMNGTGEIVFWNPAAVRMFGHSLSEALGRNLHQLIAPARYIDSHLSALQGIVSHGGGAAICRTVDLEAVRKDGQEISIQLSLSAVHLGGHLHVVGIVRDVTKRRLAQEALHESREVLHAVLDSIPVRVFWKDCNLMYLGCNAAFARDAGFESPKGVIGKDDFAMGWHGQADLYRADDRAVIESGKEKRLIEEPQTTPSGEQIWLLTSKLPLKDADGVITGVLGTYYDITELKLAQRQQALLSAAIDSAAEVIVVTNSDGTIEFANPSFERMTGYTRESVVGKKASINKSGHHDKAFYDDLWATIRSGRTWHGQFRNQRKDGSLYDEEATISPILGPDGAIHNYVAVKRDITHELVLEQQLRQSQKMEALGTLAGGVAHDFNNMLTAMIGMASLIQTLPLQRSEIEQYATEIIHTGSRAAELTRQLLAYSRKQTQETAHVDINVIITDLSHMLHRLLGGTITLELRLASSPLEVLGNRVQLEQVIMNLVVNARDALPAKGNIILTTSEKSIAAEDSEKLLDLAVGNYALIECIDNGTGIAPEVIEHIWEPFYTTKELGKGTGLGLSTVFGIVKQHHGHLSVQSQIGHGSTFAILLPIDKAGQEHAQVNTDARATTIDPVSCS